MCHGDKELRKIESSATEQSVHAFNHDDWILIDIVALICICVTSLMSAGESFLALAIMHDARLFIQQNFMFIYGSI